MSLADAAKEIAKKIAATVHSQRHDIGKRQVLRLANQIVAGMVTIRARIKARGTRVGEPGQLQAAVVAYTTKQRCTTEIVTALLDNL
jgi:hypothetical protein